MVRAPRRSCSKSVFHLHEWCRAPRPHSRLLFLTISIASARVTRRLGGLNLIGHAEDIVLSRGGKEKRVNKIQTGKLNAQNPDNRDQANDSAIVGGARVGNSPVQAAPSRVVPRSLAREPLLAPPLAPLITGTWRW